MNTERIILSNLSRVHPRLMPVPTLWSEVRLDAGHISYSAFKAAMTELEIKEQITVVTGEDRTKAKITDAGIARLAE